MFSLTVQLVARDYEPTYLALLTLDHQSFVAEDVTHTSYYLLLGLFLAVLRLTGG